MGGKIALSATSDCMSNVVLTNHGKIASDGGWKLITNACSDIRLIYTYYRFTRTVSHCHCQKIRKGRTDGKYRVLLLLLNQPVDEVFRL